MKALCLLVLAVFCWADEATDRADVARTIAALNQLPVRTDLFTPDSDAPRTLERLWRGKHPSFRPIGPLEPGLPTVEISHEPWGEATIVFPGMGRMPRAELTNPRISVVHIRFLTPETALADAVCTYRSSSIAVESTPLLLIMKKQDGVWRIAALRILERGAEAPALQHPE